MSRAPDSDHTGINRSSFSDEISDGRPSPECLIYMVCGYYGGDVSCEIYAIDIAKQAEELSIIPRPMPKPVRTFTQKEIPACMNYFMVGDYIYMIGGVKAVPSTPDLEALNCVFTYNVITSELCPHQSMHYPKSRTKNPNIIGLTHPIIIGPIKDAENLVYYVIGARLDFHGFESFIVNPDQPRRGRWIALQQPEIPLLGYVRPPPEDYTISGHAIVNDNLILFSTISAGMYGYNIQRDYWMLVDPVGILPFYYGAQYLRGLYYGYSSAHVDPTRKIIAYSTGQWGDLIVDRLPYCINYTLAKTICGLLPFPDESPFVCLTPLTDDVLCLVRTGDSNRFIELKGKKLVGFNVFHLQVEDDDTIKAEDHFSATYFLDEAHGFKQVVACLPSKQAAINFLKIHAPLEMDVMIATESNGPLPFNQELEKQAAIHSPLEMDVMIATESNGPLPFNQELEKQAAINLLEIHAPLEMDVMIATESNGPLPFNQELEIK